MQEVSSTATTSVDAATSKASSICSKVGNPTKSSSAILSKLFGGSKSLSRKKRLSFDPTAECVVASQQLKKKATNTMMKPKRVTVVLLKGMPPTVPKGYTRSKLTKANRIAKISLKRCMASSEVRKVISDTFSGFNTESAQYLRCKQNNMVEVCDDQELNGDEAIDLAGQGSLYLIQCPVDVSLVAVCVCAYSHVCHS